MLFVLFYSIHSFFLCITANSAEDAKSEMMKLFQESWERDNGFFYTDTLPPVTKYAEDILRQKKAATS